MRHDVHMHMVLDGVDWRAGIARHKEQVQQDYVRKVLSIYQQQGYTDLRDGGDRWGAGARAREIAKEYGIPAIARMPLDPKISVLADNGRIEDYDASALAEIFAQIEKAERK